MLRVLHILGGLGTGGTESLIINWYRNIDREKIQFDFLVRSKDDNYKEEIEALGGRVFYTASFPRHFLRNYRETKAILAKKEWNVIHVHANAAMYILPLKLAAKMGYPCRITHSHSVKAQNAVFSCIHAVNRRRLSRYTTLCLACSDSAGKWMFGNDRYEILRNAVNFETCRFDSDARNAIRQTYGIENKFVVGHIGRFVEAKNHLFLLEAFSEFRKQRPDSVLMLVGDGELEETVREKASQMGLWDSVMFMGRRSDVGKLLSAMDLFVLPSRYEGLGIVLVEAQFSGLPCIVSEEAFQAEVEITDHIARVSLQNGTSAWTDQMQLASRPEPDRQIDDAFARSSGYDMCTEIKKLEAYYLQAVGGNTH